MLDNTKHREKRSHSLIRFCSTLRIQDVLSELQCPDTFRTHTSLRYYNITTTKLTVWIMHFLLYYFSFETLYLDTFRSKTIDSGLVRPKMDSPKSFSLCHYFFSLLPFWQEKSIFPLQHWCIPLVTEKRNHMDIFEFKHLFKPSYLTHTQKENSKIFLAKFENYFLIP